MSTDTTTPTEEPTPETDALILARSGFGPTGYEWRTQARRLERQRNAARAELSKVYQWIERNHPDGFIDSQTHWQNLERVTDYNHARLDLKDTEFEELKAAHIQMCTNLQMCVQKHGIGLGGEKLDQLVCDHIDAQDAQITAMREAIKEAHGALRLIVLETLQQWESTRPLPCIGTIENAATATLAKLQPFTTPGA